MATSLHDNYEFYLAHKVEIVKNHAFKFILISDRKIVGSFDTQEEAVVKGQEISTPGEYLVKYVTLDEEQPLQFNHWVRVVGAPPIGFLRASADFPGYFFSHQRPSTPSWLFQSRQSTPQV